MRDDLFFSEGDFIDMAVARLRYGRSVVVDTNFDGAVSIIEEANEKVGKFVLVLAANESSRAEFHATSKQWYVHDDFEASVEITSSAELKSALAKDPTEGWWMLIVLPQVVLELKKKDLQDVWLIVVEKAEENFFKDDITRIRKRLFSRKSTLILTNDPTKFIAENNQSMDTPFHILPKDEGDDQYEESEENFEKIIEKGV